MLSLQASLPGPFILLWTSEVGPYWSLGIQTESVLDIPVRICMTWTPVLKEHQQPRVKPGVHVLHVYDFRLFL